MEVIKHERVTYELKLEEDEFEVLRKILNNLVFDMENKSHIFKLEENELDVLNIITKYL